MSAFQFDFFGKIAIIFNIFSLINGESYTFQKGGVELYKVDQLYVQTTLGGRLRTQRDSYYVKVPLNYSSTWSKVCFHRESDYWGVEEANAFCKRTLLRYTRGIPIAIKLSTARPLPTVYCSRVGRGRVAIVDSCVTGNETSFPCLYSAGVKCVSGDTVSLTRLVEGRLANTGRVEVLSWSGTWAAINVGLWTWTDKHASVVCRTLGYNGGYATNKGHFGESVGPSFTITRPCKETDNDVTDCLSGKPVYIPRYRRSDAGVVCRTEKNLIRYWESRLTLYHGGGWLIPCRGEFGMERNLALVFCNSIGFSGAPKARLRKSFVVTSTLKSGNYVTMTCPDDAKTIRDCSLKALTMCPYKYYTSLSCPDTKARQPSTAWFENSVQLTPISSGILLVRYKSLIRSRVCAEGWTAKSSNVVCKELGHGRAVSTSNKSVWYSDMKYRRLVYLSKFNCSGDESKLSDCPHLVLNKDKDCPSSDYVRFPAVSISCAKKYLVCISGQFRCANKQACVSLRDVCDGYKDCVDGSDEDDCQPRRNIFSSEQDGLDGGTIGGITVSVIVGFMLLMCLLLAVKSRRCDRDRRARYMQTRAAINAQVQHQSPVDRTRAQSNEYLGDGTVIMVVSPGNALWQREDLDGHFVSDAPPSYTLATSPTYIERTSRENLNSATSRENVNSNTVMPLETSEPVSSQSPTEASIEPDAVRAVEQDTVREPQLAGVLPESDNGQEDDRSNNIAATGVPPPPSYESLMSHPTRLEQLDSHAAD